MAKMPMKVAMAPIGGSVMMDEDPSQAPMEGVEEVAPKPIARRMKIRRSVKQAVADTMKRKFKPGRTAFVLAGFLLMTVAPSLSEAGGDCDKGFLSSKRNSTVNVTVSSTALRLTVPQGTTCMVVNVESNSIRWTDDETTP